MPDQIPCVRPTPGDPTGNIRLRSSPKEGYGSVLAGLTVATTVGGFGSPLGRREEVTVLGLGERGGSMELTEIVKPVKSDGKSTGILYSRPLR
jgi:hypothetical protein